MASSCPAESSPKPFLVCAIDFGTTYTGFAFSFRDDERTMTLSSFYGSDDDRGFHKTPTCLLLNKDKSFCKFGIAALERYRELLDERKADDFFFFEKFKMKLYQTKSITTDATIPDTKKNLFPAIDIFTKVLRHLREEIEKEIKVKCAGVQYFEPLWVLTVPAIWSDSAKSFMRKAAVKAGIDNGQLTLCLEPEAASLWCLEENVSLTSGVDGSLERKPFPVGQKYIIADLGGGTADLSVHEILPGRNLREIRRSDGGNFGGELVNAAFFQFLDNVFGKNVMVFLRRHNEHDILDLSAAFERKKKLYKTDSSDSYKIKLPMSSIKEAIKEVNDGESFEERIAKARERYCDNFSLVPENESAHSIEIKKPIFEEFFSPAADGIITFIRELRKNDELNEINAMFMVGGFSGAMFVRNCIAKRLKGLKVFIPEQHTLAVVKGAVLMGHNPRTISSKISRFTYGLSICTSFKHGTDPVRFKVFQNGVEYCCASFLKLVGTGQIFKPGEEFIGNNVPHIGIGDRKFCSLKTSLYRSEEEEPEYADEEYGCEVGAQIIMPPPEKGWPELTWFRPTIVLGQSEVSVKVDQLGEDGRVIKPIQVTVEFM